MEYVISIATSLVSAMLVFVLQSCMKENRQLKQEQKTKQSRRERALEDGVVCLLRKQLMDEHAKYMEMGYINSKALENGILMYQAYKSLGGNGMIDHMDEEIQALPIKD